MYFSNPHFAKFRPFEHRELPFLLPNSEQKRTFQYKARIKAPPRSGRHFSLSKKSITVKTAVLFQENWLQECNTKQPSATKERYGCGVSPAYIPYFIPPMGVRRSSSAPFVSQCTEKALAARRALQRVEKPFSARWETAKKVRKTSNSRPSAYIDTVGRELRSKSKFL